MLKKQNRLKKSSSFKATYCQNRVVSDEFFILHAGKNKENSDYKTKIGFVVSKKVDKRAVVRNKIKRRLREALYLYLKNNNPTVMSLIFTAKVSAKNANFFQIQKSAEMLLDRIAKKYI